MFKRLRCIFRWHQWEQHANPEVGGKESLYFVCSSCGKEKMAWGPPTEGGIRGIAGGGFG